MAQQGGRRRLGKLTALGWLLLAHGPELEADFQQFYGVELGACSPRRACVLSQQLPTDSRVVRALSPEAGWTTAEHLLALVNDQLAISNWLFAAANRKEKTPEPPRPKPLPRPGDKSKDDTPSGGRALARLLGAG